MSTNTILKVIIVLLLLTFILFESFFITREKIKLEENCVIWELKKDES